MNDRFAGLVTVACSLNLPLLPLFNLDYDSVEPSDCSIKLVLHSREEQLNLLVFCP